MQGVFQKDLLSLAYEGNFKNVQIKLPLQNVHFPSSPPGQAIR